MGFREKRYKIQEEREQGTKGLSKIKAKGGRQKINRWKYIILMFKILVLCNLAF